MTTPSSWQSGTVEANGLHFHYTRTGDSTKPPLVLAHGFSDNGLCWTPIGEQLAPTYDVIMVDARHHGLSDSPDQPFTIVDLADDLAGVIIGLALEQPIVMGHSLGAITSLILGGRYPQLPRALILEDPPPWWSPSAQPPFDPGWLVPTRLGLVAQQAESREAIIAKKHAESPIWQASELGPWADSKLSLNLKALDRVGAAEVNWPILLQQVACPVLLITADPSLKSAVTVAQAAELVDLLPQTQVVHIPNAGHNIRREQFAAYLAALHPFLADVTPKA